MNQDSQGPGEKQCVHALDAIIPDTTFSLIPYFHQSPKPHKSSTCHFSPSPLPLSSSQSFTHNSLLTALPLVSFAPSCSSSISQLWAKCRLDPELPSPELHLLLRIRRRSLVWIKIKHDLGGQPPFLPVFLQLPSCLAQHLDTSGSCHTQPPRQGSTSASPWPHIHPHLLPLARLLIQILFPQDFPVSSKLKQICCYMPLTELHNHSSWYSQFN